MTDPVQAIPTEALEAELLRRQAASGGPLTPAQARKLTPEQAQALLEARGHDAINADIRARAGRGAPRGSMAVPPSLGGES